VTAVVREVRQRRSLWTKGGGLFHGPKNRAVGRFAIPLTGEYIARCVAASVPPGALA